MALTTAPAIDYALPRQQDEGDHWIDDWRPEDPVFWETIGRPIARRNLIFSIFAEHVGFSVWMLWSIVVVQMTAAAPPPVGLHEHQSHTPHLVGHLVDVSAQHRGQVGVDHGGIPARDQFHQRADLR